MATAVLIERAYPFYCKSCRRITYSRAYIPICSRCKRSTPLKYVRSLDPKMVTIRKQVGLGADDYYPVSNSITQYQLERRWET
jgi:hypothetical protein